MARMNIVHGMQHLTTSRFRVGRNYTARHPVVAMEDQLAAILRTDRLNDVVYHFLLKFGGVQEGISRIGTRKIGKYRRAH